MAEHILSKDDERAAQNCEAQLHKIGIYLAYPPNVELEAEGLGRYLAMLLSGFAKNGSKGIPVLCPSWSATQLAALLEAESVDSEVIEIISPRGRPYALTMWMIVAGYRSKISRSRALHAMLRGLVRIKAAVAETTRRALSNLAASFVQIFSIPMLLRFLVTQSWLLLVMSALVPVILITSLISSAVRQAQRVLSALPASLTALAGPSPHQVAFVPYLYDEMLAQEKKRMQRLGDRLVIDTWYCPTAFWPEVLDLSSNVVVCVPDFAIRDYPIEFAQLSGARALRRTNDIIIETIAGSRHLITYSEAEKSKLVKRFKKREEDIFVLPHATSSLSRYLPGLLPTPDQISDERPSTSSPRAARRDKRFSAIKDGSLEFIFYPSQVRPNKNLRTLLKAFAGLRSSGFPELHLVLTGDLERFSDITKLARNLKVSEAVFSLGKLPLEALAITYNRASATVSPTLSEGGFPFTFSESVSCRTPVVMGSIPVVIESIEGWTGADEWLCDPYDAADMSKRVAYVLRNRDSVLENQYQLLKHQLERDWSDVASDLVTILSKVGTSS